MPEIDQIDNEAKTLCWARGDDSPRVVTIERDGVAVDISTWTLAMAVNTDLNPVGTANEIFRVAGIFVTDGSDGKVRFTPPPTSLDSVAAPSVAFYDINRLTPSKDTMIKGKVEFVMDVDKA